MVDRKLTNRQALFLEALLSQEAMGDFRKAMRIAGYSETTKAVDLARILKAEIRDHAELLLALHAPKAVSSIIEVLDNPTGLGARNQLLAAKEVLDRVGITQKSALDLALNTPTAAMFILPPKSE